jgi:hypothetical protein
MKARILAAPILTACMVLGAVAAPQLCVAPTVSVPQGAAIRRTQGGQPDLQGLWLNNTATPLERSKGFEERPFFTDAEALAYEQTYQLDRVRASSGSGRGGTSSDLDVDFAMAASDLDTFEAGHVLPDRRTSLIVDPPNGKVPGLTPQARARIAERAARWQQHYAENPENLPNSERCLVVANTAVPPLLPNVYNNTLQVVQTQDSVAVVSETIHDARIIALNRKAHLPDAIKQWKGDSIGRWDGDTLVVDTTNFSDQIMFRGSGPRLHVIERFSLISADLLRYEFMITDEDTFTQSWRAVSVFTRTTQRMFEFACHEGNYSLENTLRGARFADKERP